jgi:hypothetical protein
MISELLCCLIGLAVTATGYDTLHRVEIPYKEIETDGWRCSTLPRAGVSRSTLDDDMQLLLPQAVAVVVVVVVVVVAAQW